MALHFNWPIFLNFFLNYMFPVYILSITIYAYYLMWKDKRSARSGKRRISEKSLLFIALIGGSFGIFLGTKYPLYHKSSKWKFHIGVPLILVFQMVLTCYFYKSLLTAI